MFLLDTNVISELRKVNSGRANENVCHWLSQIHSAQLYLSVMTVFELEHGILRVERKDKIQGKLLRQWLDGYVLPFFANKILPIDLSVVRQCAKLHIPDPKPASDMLIAATALVHGFTVVTHNVKDFIDTGVAIIDPWQFL
ncbi:PIN domain-containing protein [Bartonella sp. B17]